MRRRLRSDRTLTAEALVALGAGVLTETLGCSLEVTNHAMRQRLADYGYTPLDLIRARFWLRRGKPQNYFWDDPDRPIPNHHRRQRNA